MRKINLATPHVLGNELNYVRDAIESNWIAPLGEYVNRLEQDICKMVGCEASVALCSGTAAIHLALIEAGVREGDIVFCSDLTFTATANPIRYCGATPVFIDCDNESFNMCPEALEKAFEKYNPKAVVVASIYGIPAKLEELAKICESHGVPMIEDSTEVLGSTYKGKYAGTFGKWGTYSFNGNKIITTSGGGMLVSNDKNSISHALFLSTQAKDLSRYYEHSDLGFNYRLSNICAALGVAQLETINTKISAKKYIFNKYDDGLREFVQYGVKMLPVPEDRTSNYWLSVLVLDERAYTKPEEIVDILAKENIEARHVWKPLHTQKLWNGCDFITCKTGEANSDWAFKHALCLPSDTNMTDEEQEKVIAVIRTYLTLQMRLYYQQGM